MWPFSSHPKTPPAEVTQSPSNIPVSESRPHIAPELNSPADQDGVPAQEPKMVFTYTGWPHERLSIPFLIRAPILMTASFVCGFSLGAANGGTKAAFRYRAENAHRLPTTQTGWYLYQKSKNYHTMLGGIKEGVKFGGVCTGWATLFMITEEVVDQARGRLFARGDQEFAPGQRDVGGTVIAAMNMAGLYSWKKGFDRFAAARTAKLALKYSFVYGLIQDAVSTLRGEKPAYVNWVSKKLFGASSDKEGT